MTSAWIDGRPAPADALRALALANYGHFSTMQVRGGAVQGFDLHLRRLRDATRELFGCDLDPERTRGELRRALSAAPATDCTLRATVFAPGLDPLRGGPAGTPRILVTLSPPLAPGGGGLRVRSYGYRRELPNVKHVGTFALLHYRRRAVLDGYDDALFVDAQERVLEGSVWNVGFVMADGVVWPEGPALRGVTERLLQAGLSDAGIAQTTRPVSLDELAGFRGAFACNSRGVRIIDGIDAVEYAPDTGFARLLAEALAARPWQRI
ncbi:aminotransferase class IV [Luteimonas sp. R10]|uniref:aminotransferase class IV n=1 Tax=Luteimonas sp. R10 TaxID=3108176 RepID=UPI00308AACDA|nr:aminotransferase class IV [Luteimonas sp. R10]